MAAVTIAPYSHDAYHTVTKPSLHEAIKAFNAANAMHYINTVIRDCVIKHNVQQQFTACIKHRHFDLTPDQRNIEEEDGRAFGSSNLENITPCSWLFHEGKLYPYEFKRQAGEQPSGPPQAFVDELGAIVEKHGLCDVIAYKRILMGSLAWRKRIMKIGLVRRKAMPRARPSCRIRRMRL